MSRAFRIIPGEQPILHRPLPRWSNETFPNEPGEGGSGNVAGFATDRVEDRSDRGLIAPHVEVVEEEGSRSATREIGNEVDNQVLHIWQGRMT